MISSYNLAHLTLSNAVPIVVAKVNDETDERLRAQF